MKCPATGMACFNCKVIGHLKAVFRKPAAATSTSTTESDSVVPSLNYIGQVSGNATVVYNPNKHRAKKSQQCELRVRLDKKTFTQMEFRNSQLRRTRPASHPLITLNATISNIVYNKLTVRAPKGGRQGSPGQAHRHVRHGGNDMYHGEINA